MRKIAMMLCALMLAGCGNTEPKPTTVKQGDGERVTFNFSNGYSGELQVVAIKVNGRNVECVVMSGYREGGVSCDYEWAIREG